MRYASALETLLLTDPCRRNILHSFTYYALKAGLALDLSAMPYGIST
ncbi:hypothetical protein GA0061070_102342 [Kosakonia oryziphila]|uniref:Uncharacterized protein n=1 Tax=Kosakonia oryziphila TaxID=1005667 RepID=A0A1C4EGN7_9ENTR|nr:hypothetical protein GA0061070_102342 [Kosakonia oryziphila]